MTHAPYDRPSTFPWPPAIYLGAIVTAIVLNWIVPLDSNLSWPIRAIGGAVLAGGILLDLAAILTLKRHNTGLRPDRAASALVTDGPYALSRNPIYLGNTVALLGAAVLFDLPWLAILLLPCTLLVHRLAVLREEAHLAARFGEEWSRYASRVRRWI